MAQQKFPKAYEAYQQAVYRDGRNPTFWCSIGVLYYQINQYRDALDAYSRAIRLNPYISEVWYDLGTLVSEDCSSAIFDAHAHRPTSTNRAIIRPQMLWMHMPEPPSLIPPTPTSRRVLRFSEVEVRLARTSTMLRCLKTSILKRIRMALVCHQDPNGMGLHPPTNSPNSHRSILPELASGQEAFQLCSNLLHLPTDTRAAME